MTTQRLGGLGTAAGTGDIPTHVDTITKPLLIKHREESEWPMEVQGEGDLRPLSV